jgi:DNA replication and repair protein RecF
VLLQGLLLTDYRNLAEAEISLGPGFTVLWGHNGAGKTNVLEAIYLVSTLRSFRTSDLGVLVREGTAGSRVVVRGYDEALGVGSTLEVRLERSERTTRRTAVADGKLVRSAAAFYGRVRAVLFTPEDLGVLRGGPTGRRQFMDRVLFGRERGHIADVQAYEKLLRSRNRVLRDDAVRGSERQRMLETYEAGLAQVGARLWTRRVELLAELQGRFSEAFSRIHGQAGEHVGEAGPASEHEAAARGAGPVASLRYACKLGEVAAAEREAALLSALAERRELDERRGGTSVGPHRDDLVVELDGRSAGDFASQGQSRALVLAFKLAEVQAARERSPDGSPPLLLLDDVSSELDPGRTALLFRTLGEQAGQCILTTTSPRFIDLPPQVEARRFRVDRGTIVPDEGAA